MMDAKLRADVAIVRKKQARQTTSRSSQGISSSGNH
jgi:hypothetical protein